MRPKRLNPLTPTEEPNPSRNDVYSAWVKHNGGMMALIENSKTRVGAYVSIGDSLEEFGVATAISDEPVTTKWVSKTYTFGRLRDIDSPDGQRLLFA